MYIGRIAKKIMKLEDLHYQILKAIILTIKHRFYFNAMGKIIVISIIGIWISIWREKKESCSYNTLYTQINSMCIVDLNVKGKTFQR